MTEDRADYMMDAFLDEQNTLIRPLVSRKLNLVKILDERAVVVEKILDEKRRRFHQTKRASDLEEVEGLEDELEQLSEEKVNVLLQLMDLVKRPYDTILEVESVLQNATEREASVAAVSNPSSSSVGRRSTSSSVPQSVNLTATNESSFQMMPSPPEEELWCFCRKADDGRRMVACDNAKCDLVWWHLDCIEKYIAANRVGVSPPQNDDSKKWHCPVCIAQEIVSRETGEADKVRRRRR